MEVGVVGASLAGLHAARLLAEAGCSVRVFECSPDARPLRRSLIVTDAYRELLGDFGESAVVNEIETFELFADGRRMEVQLGAPDLIIERAELLRCLYERAVESGVEILTNQHFRSLSAEGSGLELQFHGSVPPARAAVVIGADGARSRVARAAGLPESPVVPLVQALVRLPSSMSTHRTRVWFVPEETPYFYWLIPDSNTTGALGVIGCERSSARALLDRFVERENLEVLEYQAARIPEYAGWQRLHRRVGSGDVYLVGDAAGHVKVTTVGGVVNGLWGAEGVVDRILGRAHGRLLSLRLELGMHLLIRRAMHHFGEDEYRQLLGMLDEASKGCLGEHTRDETLKLMTSLLLKRPRFGLLGLRGLLDGIASRGSEGDR